jgi:4-nitrophenyl phosphatase
MRPVRNIVVDLDGVMWVGEMPLPGSGDGVNRLVDAGRRVVFVTNMSRLTVTAQQARLAGCGVRPPMEVVTSAVAAASLLAPGDRVMVCGGPGVAEAIESAGAVVACYATDPSDAAEDSQEGALDAVVVGMDPGFDYAACGRAMRAVRAGARLIGTNHDPTYPTPTGLETGGGAILAAVAAAAEVEPVLAGKPNEATVSCLRGSLGDGHGIVIGDRPDSDGLLAEALGFDFALVLSGVTTGGDLPVTPEPAVVASDLAGVVDAVL